MSEHRWIHEWLQVAAYYEWVKHPHRSADDNWNEAVIQFWFYCIFRNIDVPAANMV